MKAYAIGPDRYDVVVGEFDSPEEAGEWYKAACNVPDDEWQEYGINEHPMDKPMNFENERICTLREFVADVQEFPCIACWVED